MMISKCRVCGGNLIPEEGTSFAKCESCGSVQTYPKFDDNERHLRYETADYERRNHNFDTALSIFSEMAVKSGFDSEIHWEIMLCRYGILFQPDPKTFRDIPTLNRTQRISVYEDPDYIKTIEYAEPSVRSYYQDMADQIEEIRSRYIRVIQREDPYDVFLCFKENDEISGQRTRDSIQAQELYEYLSKSGYKVFFSRITLADKAGEEYEPYIFSALNSSRVMFVFGSDRRYVNAPWVKNEWSRFLALIKEDRGRILIPVYNGRPDSFPRELSGYQGFDINIPGWYQDAKGRVDAFTGKKGSQTVLRSSAEMADTLFKNAETNLSVLGDYSTAEDNYREMTKKYPHDFRGWWGLLRVKTGCFNNPQTYESHHSHLIQYYENIGKTADQEGKNKIEQEMRCYLALVAKEKKELSIKKYTQELSSEIPLQMQSIQQTRKLNQDLKSALSKEKESLTKGSTSIEDENLHPDIVKGLRQLEERIGKLDANTTKELQGLRHGTERKTEEYKNARKGIPALNWIAFLFLSFWSFGLTNYLPQLEDIPANYVYALAAIGLPIIGAILAKRARGRGAGGWGFFWGCILVWLPIGPAREIIQENPDLPIIFCSIFLLLFVINLVIFLKKRSVNRREIVNTEKYFKIKRKEIVEKKAADIASMISTHIDEINIQLKNLDKQIDECNQKQLYLNERKSQLEQYLKNPEKIQDFLYAQLCQAFNIKEDTDKDFSVLAEAIHDPNYSVEDLSVSTGAIYDPNCSDKDETVITDWVCKVCGYVEKGGNLPEDFICPICKSGVRLFEKNSVH